MALTETCNAYVGMPNRLDELGGLAGRLDDVRQANLDHHVELMRAAAGAGAQAIGFGELFGGPFFALTHDAMWHAFAEVARGGPTERAIAPVAAELGMVVVAPIYERDPDSGRLFNSALVIDADGATLGVYRKVHLPLGENEQASFHEPFYFEPSDGAMVNDPAHLCSSNPYFPVFRTQVGCIGVAICYDRHFEGVAFTLANAGAELIFSPAVTFGAKSERMWALEFAVDAARHNVFIAGSNRRGSEPPWNQPFFGRSYVVGPNGRSPNRSDHPHLVIAEVDLDELRAPDPAGWDLPRDIRYTAYTPRPDAGEEWSA